MFNKKNENESRKYRTFAAIYLYFSQNYFDSIWPFKTKLLTSRQLSYGRERTKKNETRIENSNRYGYRFGCDAMVVRVCVELIYLCLFFISKFIRFAFDIVAFAFISALIFDFH